MPKKPQQSDSEPSIGNARVSPTKAFFVRMLTRDIELDDALLDLLDNCVDGAVRMNGSTIKQRPFEGRSAQIMFGEDEFFIEDNCGGIPFETAKHYAFAMGRPPNAPVGNNSATVGMYGIGMKRAIFKLGSEAVVETHNDRAFKVEFTRQWMGSDDWNDLPMIEVAVPSLPTKGTRISVSDLRDEVKLKFNDPQWRDEFRKFVSRHYSIIISKGFEVSVGFAGSQPEKPKPIQAAKFELIRAAKLEDGSQIEPILLVADINGVQVEIYAGLYRRLLNATELEREEEARQSSDDAGWTIACNDRVVVWKDKSRLTGWGEATVPNYHGQFIAVTGIVLMRSDDPKSLPLTTTKRGIDAGSDIYSQIKDQMRNATKTLTSFTNKWKNFPQNLEEMYQKAEYVDLEALRAMPATVAMTDVRGNKLFKKHEPNLPTPVQSKDSDRISFIAKTADVKRLGQKYFDGEKFSPSQVGENAFAEAVASLRDTKKSRK